MIDAKPKRVSAEDIKDLEAEANGQYCVAMTREYVDKHDVVHRYVCNQLDEKELEEFEALFVNDPSLLDEIDIEVAMKNGIAMAKSRLEPRSEPTTGRGWLAWLTQPVVAVASLAALMLTTVTAIYLQSELTAVQSGTPFMAQYIDAEVWLENARSSSGQRELPALTTGRLTLLKIEIPPRSGEVAIVIEQPDGTRRTLSKTRAADDGTSSVLINPDAAGDYTITVKAIADDRELVRYQFEAIE